MRAQAAEQTGYDAEGLAHWTKDAQQQAKKGDVYSFFISGAKERNPAAAQAMIVALK